MAIEETDTWVNKSKSGKALNFEISGTRYTIAVSTASRLISDEIKGLKLGKYTPDPAKQEEYKKESEKAVV